MDKRFFFVFLILTFFSAPLFCSELQITESVPEETVYGSTLTARPQAIWLDMISGAQKTLDFEEFYFESSTGEALEPIVNAIMEKAEKGVKVRFIFEKAMMTSTRPNLELLKSPNIEIEVIDFKKIAGGIQHAKFFIADGREVYSGSQNFDWRSMTQIHELGVRIKDPETAAVFSGIFNIDWAMAKGEKAEFTKLKKIFNSKHPAKGTLNGETVFYYPAFSPKKNLPAGLDSEIGELMSLIKTAKKTLRAQVMTFHPQKEKWNELSDAFVKAGGRGVSVELILADWNMGGKYDNLIKELAGKKNISIKISSLPRLSRGFIPFARVEHCKYLVVDGEKGLISTSNWGYDYFYQTRGASIILEGKKAGEILEDIFSKSWNGPYVSPIDQSKTYEKVIKN